VPGVTHLRRPSLSRHHPVHVTLRIAGGVASLRDGQVFDAVRFALAAGRECFGFRLVHFNVQSNHLHLIAEASDRRALALGMQGLSVRVARAVNRTLARRYHSKALKTPRAVHFAVRYVLLKARKHRAAIVPGFIDSRSSAAWFDNFSRPDELAFGAAQTRARWRASSGLEAPVVSAQSWLLRQGSRRYGAFDIDDAPGPTEGLRLSGNTDPCEFPSRCNLRPSDRRFSHRDLSRTVCGRAELEFEGGGSCNGRRTRGGRRHSLAGASMPGSGP
jgi:REP element-mobilizing transposase RayT